MSKNELYAELRRMEREDKDALARWRLAQEHAQEQVSHSLYRLQSTTFVAARVLREIEDAEKEAQRQADAEVREIHGRTI